MSIIDDAKQSLSDYISEYQDMLINYLDPEYSGDRVELLSEMAELNNQILTLQNIIIYSGM